MYSHLYICSYIHTYIHKSWLVWTVDSVLFEVRMLHEQLHTTREVIPQPNQLKLVAIASRSK